MLGPSPSLAPQHLSLHNLSPVPASLLLSLHHSLCTSAPGCVSQNPLHCTPDPAPLSQPLFARPWNCCSSLCSLTQPQPPFLSSPVPRLPPNHTPLPLHALPRFEFKWAGRIRDLIKDTKERCALIEYERYVGFEGHASCALPQLASFVMHASGKALVSCSSID